MTEPNFRALAQQLLHAYVWCIEEYMTTPAEKDALVLHARAALATPEPEPEPPTELPPLLTAALKLQEENDLSRLFLPKRNLCSEVYLPVSEKPCSLPPPYPKPMTKYSRTIRTIIITPSDDIDSPIYSEKAISVSVEDEAAGPFIVLRTNDEVSGRGEIRLDVEELEEAAKVARELMEQEVLKWPFKEVSQSSSQAPLGVIG